MKFPGIWMGWMVCAPMLWAQAAPAVWQWRTAPDQAEALYQGRPLLKYVFTNTQFKPYVKELRTLQGHNVLLDAPPDHLHHHGLMLAFKVNDINFWEESPTAGVQVVAGPSTVCYIDPLGGAVIHQRLYWVSQADRRHPESARAALLREERSLRLRVEETLGEVSVEWHSQFTTGTNATIYRISGSGYHGLGLRPVPSFNRVAQRLNPMGAAYTAEAKWDVVGGEWAALVGRTMEGDQVTLTIFNHPLNTVPPFFFSMLNPFAYVSATQSLDKQPKTYRAGESFSLRYRVTVHQGARTVEFLNQRAYLKAASGN